VATVLIIDDREANREYLITLLGYSEHHVLEASDGEEGLAVVLSERPDLVITDILMPTMDGYEFVRRLRAEPEVAGTPVIFLTAHYHDREARALAAACRVSQVLIKPAEPELILAAVAEALGGPAVPAEPVPELEFDREHLRLVTDKLSEKAADLRRANDQLSALVDLGLRLGSERDPVSLLQSVCNAGREIVGARVAVLGVLNGDRTNLRHITTSGLAAGAASALEIGDALSHVLDDVLRNSASVRFDNAEIRTLGLEAPFPSGPLKSLLVVPIVSPTRVYGWLCLLDKLGAESFTVDDQRLAGIIGAQTGRVYENGSLYADLLAHTESLAQEVDERKRAELERDRFFTQSLDMLCVAGFDGYFRRVNPSFENTLGFSQAELTTTPFMEFVHPLDRKDTLRQVEALTRGEVTTSFEIRCLRHDGSYRWVLWNATPFLDQNGFYAAGHDITERKLAEAALAERVRQASLVAEVGVSLASPESLRVVLLQCVHALMTHLDTPFVRIWTVREAEQVLVLEATSGSHADSEQLGRQVPVGKLHVGRIAADRRADVTNALHEDPNVPDLGWVKREGLVAFAGHPLMVGDSLVGVITLFAQHPLSAATLDCLGAVANQIALGIERKWADEALAESDRHLRATQLRLGRVVGSSPAVLFTLSIEALALTWCSPNISDMLGYPLEEVYAPGWWGRSTHPEDVARTLADTQSELLEQGRIANEFRFRHVDGTYRWIRNEMRLLTDDSDTPVEIVGSWSDITERKHLEDQFRQSQKMEAIGRLAGGIAHDFNNLLSVILGYADLIRMRMPESDPNRDMIGEMGAAAKRAASLTRQLLAFSRKAILNPTILDLTDVVRSMEKMLHRIIGEDIQLVTLADPDLGTIKADPGHIEQVVLNLAVNARDAMPRGGQVVIEVRNRDADESFRRVHPEATASRYVMLAVSDTGCGMNQETLTRLWEPFFSTKGELGTGLGLATVYGIIQQSGGLVSVSSELGTGSIFELYLPRVDEPTLETTVVATPTSMPGGNETVLVVEDEEAVRILTCQVLEGCGYQILEAGDAAEALRIAAAYPDGFDLLLTDVVMPRMGGPELARQLQESHPGLKTLFVSGYTDDAVVRHGVLTDEVNFLAKPFYPSALARKVREVLDRP